MYTHRVGDVPHIHARFHQRGTVCLRNARRHSFGHFGGGVADIDLAARDPFLRPSSEMLLVKPVMACLVAV